MTGGSVDRAPAHMRPAYSKMCDRCVGGAGNDMPIAVRARAAREEKLERERYSACT